VTAELPPAAEVVIIGGGVIGVSCAFHLEAAGVEGVLLLEQETLGSGTTAKAAGGIRASFSTRCNIEMGLRGLAAYAEFSSRFDQEIDFRRDGYLYLLSEECDLSAIEATVSRQHEYGMRTELIGPAEAQRRAPPIVADGLVGALWSPDDARATPESVVQGYAAAARRLGAVLRTGVRVTGIDTQSAEIVAVHTDAGTVRTGTVVCTAGAWSAAVGEMVGVHLPVVPLRRQVLFARPATLPANLPAITAELPSTFYFHSEGPGLAMGFSDRTETAGFKFDYEPDGFLPALYALAARRTPALLDADVAGGWSGHYEVTPDDNQIIGEADAPSRFLYATGFSGHGFMMAPAVGEIIRDLYLGRPPIVDIRACDVRRFEDTDRSKDEQVII
jgi:sarcosine oxidase subunit beta